MFLKEDAGGNIWYQQEDREFAINHGATGVHASIPFQCERCWILNLEGRAPIPGRDDAYSMIIRRANLDAMSGRAASTSKNHADEIKRMVRNCALIGKTPNIPARGPMPLADTVGMGVAVDMITRSLTSASRIKGQDYVQFGTIRKVRGTFSTGWESSPQGIQEGASFGSSAGRGSTLTLCPTQQKWFNTFAIGVETRMGYATKADKALHINVVVRMLELVREEAEGANQALANEYYKFGTAVVVGICASLRGPDIFKMDLAGIREFAHLGKNGVTPLQPMKKGTDLTGAPHVFLAFLGKFKGELGFQQHLVAVASCTQSGLEARWWIEKLIEIREAEGCTHGPAFGVTSTKAATCRDYDVMLHSFLDIIQQENNSLIDDSDDIVGNYGFFWTFRKTSETRARIAGIDSDTINGMNRWKTIERAQGRRPRWTMADIEIGQTYLRRLG
jgi:hypothetical protein